MAEATRDPNPQPPVLLKLSQDEVDALYTELGVELSRYGGMSQSYRVPLLAIAKALSPYLTPHRAFPSIPE